MIMTMGPLARDRWRRPAVRLVLVLLAALAALCVATPAFAHATLEGSTPGQGQTLQSLPATVSLHFDETVTTLPDSLRVYDPDGDRVDDGKLTHPGGDGSRIAIGLSGMKQGTYLVNWRVISADSHPVSGAFTFDVGKASATPTVQQTGNNPVTAAALGVARWVGYLGAALLIGGTAFLLVCWRQGWTVRFARRLPWLGWAAVLVGAVASLVLKGPYDAGLGPSAVGRLGLSSEVLSSAYGHALLARCGLLVVGAAALAARSRMPRPAWAASAGLVAAALVVTYPFTGHAVTGPLHVLVAVAESFHVAAMSVWVGGLIMMTLVLLRRAADVADARPASKFSPIALTCVGVLVATGIFQAWREVGAWGALTGSTYGLELLAKLILVVATLVAAQVSRGWVRRRRDRGVGSLRRSVLVETLILAGVLAITSALVATQPGRTAYRPSVSQMYWIGENMIMVDATPAGDRSMHLDITIENAEAKPVDPPEVTATAALAEKNIGPLPITLTKIGPGHYTGTLDVPFAGTWDVATTTRTSQIDSYTNHTTVPIR